MKFKLLEDAEKDHQARAEALEVWTAISKIPDSKWETMGSALKPVLILPLVIIDKKYDDLDLMLQPKGGGATGAFGSYKNNKDKNVIILFCLGKAVTKKEIFSDNFLANAFTHEFVHYLDKKRYTPGWDENSVKLKDEGNFGGYVNTNSETNAYFQELANNFERFFKEDLKMLLTKKSQEVIFSSFGAFRKFLKPNFEDYFYDQLNEKNKKHFDRRLYGFYVFMKDKLATEIEKRKKKNAE
jgi:hypothetical protein